MAGTSNSAHQEHLYSPAQSTSFSALHTPPLPRFQSAPASLSLSVLSQYPRKTIAPPYPFSV